MINKCCNSQSVIGVSCMGSPVVQGSRILVCNEPILKTCGGSNIMPGDKVMVCGDDIFLEEVIQNESSTEVLLRMSNGVEFTIDIGLAIDNYFKNKPICEEE